jgi:hypothetical protein
MRFRSFRYNFHDGQLASFTLGPRQELTVEIALDPVWNREAPPSASIRFGGIKNIEEVACYFRSLPRPSHPEAYIAEVIGLRHLNEGAYGVVIDLAGHGHIEVHSNQVTEL